MSWTYEPLPERQLLLMAVVDLQTIDSDDPRPDFPNVGAVYWRNNTLPPVNAEVGDLWYAKEL